MPQAFKTQYVLNLNHFLKLALPSSLCHHLNEAFNVPNCLSQKPESHSPRPLSLPTHTNHQLPVLPSFAWVHVSPSLHPLSSFRPLFSHTQLLSLLTWFPYLILTWVWKEQTIMSLYCLKPLIGSLFCPRSHEAPQPFLNLVSTNLSSVSSFLCTCPSLCLEYSSLQSPTSLTTTFHWTHPSSLNTISTSSGKLFSTHKLGQNVCPICSLITQHPCSIYCIRIKNTTCFYSPHTCKKILRLCLNTEFSNTHI